MGKLQETVLYYRPPSGTGQAGNLDDKQVRLLKSVLVRMGIRIKNICPGQLTETVGYLAGMPGYPPSGQSDAPEKDSAPEAIPGQAGGFGQDMLILYHFTDSRTDSLLLNLRKSKVPPIPLKAVVTPQNAHWTACRLYEELKQEHEKLHQAP